ncbi:N-acetyltransferase 16, like isoform X1 [Electrophorus electricus]|uniref:Histidine N-acetyltransferase C-terminal domain-containing protein n=1 Tax=Electrophorus electricus TaxID=8005 RepID=A0A4W4FHF0_ELEEL|nr:N-acetyltransferase 16, like isoform X1 [Electrophorus electricus]
MEAQFITKDAGLTFWLARPQDFDEVMAISNGIYGGKDYLPHRYHTWMTEPGRVVIIARRSGKLVALDSGLVVDGGQTVVMEGLRVCMSERGHGVAGVIQQVTDSYVKQVYPSVNTKRLTRGDNPPPEKLSKFTVLAQRAILTLCGEAESFKGFVLGLRAKLDTMEKLNDNKNCLVAVKDSHQLKALLLDPDLSSRLQLPGGAIIQDWQPLKPIESNLEILERRNLTWLANCASDKPTFMSFHTPAYPIPFNGGSLRFNIDMFGANLSLARKALIAHLEQETGEFHKCVLVNIYMPQTIWEGMREFCEGHEGVKQCRNYWSQLFLEQEIP